MIAPVYMAEPTLVPSTSEQLQWGTNPVTTVTRDCDQPIRSEPSGSPSTSRLAWIRGLSEGSV